MSGQGGSAVLAHANTPMTETARIVRSIATIASAIVLFLPVVGDAQQDPDVIFGVVTKVQKDHKQILAQVSSGGAAAEMSLIPSEALLENPSWKKLEVCHSLKAEGWKQADGYRIISMKLLDAGMLPMTLQGLAGDCLLKKALEFAPQID